MTIDVNKFNQIVAREQEILNGLKEPELHWYSQTHVMEVLFDVALLIKEEVVNPMDAVRETLSKTPSSFPAKKQRKTKVEDGKDN